MKTKIISLLLVLMMLIGMFPVNAFATEVTDTTDTALVTTDSVAAEPEGATQEATGGSTEATEESTEATGVSTETTEESTEATGGSTEATEEPTEATEESTEAAVEDNSAVPTPVDEAADTSAEETVDESAETPAAGTLQLSTDLSTEPACMNSSTVWNAPSTTLKVAVGTYTPAGGEATALPEGTKVTYAWYSSTDDVVDDADTKLSSTGASNSVSSRNATPSTTYYYVVATATVDGVEYSVTSNVACVKIGAANINVTLTVNNKGVIGTDKNGDAVNGKSVSVIDSNYDGKHSYDEALQAAHSKLMTADAYATVMGTYGLSVTKIWGVETTNTLFFQNGKALTTNVGDTTVAAKDALYISVNKDDRYYSDKFTTFDVATRGATTGVEFELTMTDADGKAVPNMAIGTWESGAFVPMEGKTTDENGKVKLTFDAVGTYVITAAGTIKDTVTDYSNWPEVTEIENFDCPIMAPACTITVKNAGELKFTGSFPSTAMNYKVGEKADFASLYSTVYYINGTRDNSIKPTTTWYRIGSSTGGAAEMVEGLSSSTVFTEADVGNWLYYMYAEVEAYGVKYTAMSNMATVVVSQPGAIEGSTENGFVTNIEWIRGEFNYEEGKTDYAIKHWDVASGNIINITALPGKGLWYGYRVDDVKSGTDASIKVTSTNQIKLPRTLKAGDTNVVTIIVGTKYDSNGDGTVNASDAFDVYDAYNFTVTTLPSFSSLTATDSEGTSLLPLVNAYNNYSATDLSGSTNSDTIKLTAAFKAENGVKLYVGDSKTAYDANVTDLEITLADYKDDKGVANIPLKLVAANNVENTVTLHISPVVEEVEPDFAPPVIKTQPAAESTVAKEGTVTLSVEAEQPEEGTISYQWYGGTSSSYALDSLDRITTSNLLIEGATSASFDATGLSSVGLYTKNQYYACVVTLTIDGVSSSTLSEIAQVTTELTWVNPPEITIQPGLAANKNGDGIYKTEYTAGAKFDPMWIGVQSDSVRSASGAYVHCTEYGCDPFTIVGYYNSTPSLEGATAFTGTATTVSSGGSYGRYFTFTPDVGLPEGEWYVCFVVTSTATDDPSKTASTTTDYVKLTFAPAELGLEGSGIPDDPFLLKSGEDFVTLQQQVAAGNTLFGINFKMANDITLPEDWVSMGPNGANGLFFGGIIDGDGHTLSFSKGSDGLIYHAKGAEIRNLKIYGEEIQTPALISSSWVNQTSGAWIAKIDNVTLVSGTSTLTSGLVAGSLSTYNPIYISNCYAEEGVIIGYDKSKSNIGTFAGGLIGGLTNCHSAATVYGVSNVGGLLGSQSNSMAAGNFVNCWFTGKIVATGNNVGGLMGSGYNSNSAPNGMPVLVQNCYVNAEITGKNNVGGFLGSNEGIQQAWNTTYVRNNVFYGTLTGEKNVGGLVGYYSNLNKYNIIENNYFYDTNGCTNAIGGVEHIDTSAREFGMGEDGIFYYDTSRDSLADIKEFVDAEDKGTADWQYTSVAKTNHNRTDDPMGADKETLGKAMTAEQMKDGTVLELVNSYEAGNKNWTQGDEHPIIDNRAYISGLAISGDYKTEYYIGDELDTTGMVFTASWSDGSTSSVAVEDVTIEGFDSSERASLILTASYSGSSVQFEVKVIKKPVSTEDINSIKVTFVMYGDEIHFDEDGKNLTGEVHTLKDGNLPVWIEETAYSVDLNATAWDVIQKALEENGMKCDYTYSLNTVYIASVTKGDLTLGEFDNGSNSGWMYTLNGEYPDLGVAQQFLEDGDVIVFHYSDDYTVEEDKATSGETPDVSVDTDPEKVYQDTGDYMAALGTPNVGSIGGEWMVIGLARSDREVPAGYYENVVAYVQENIDENGRLHKAKSTENSRLILALTALGYDVTDVGGHNLLTGLTSMSYLKKQGHNGPIWALIAFDSGDYEIPEGDVTREALIDYILSVQLADGGWAITGSEADSDMTGMALQTLAPYYSTNAEVKAAVDKALVKLSAMQNADGTYSTVGDATSESTAQVIVALTALGINPETDERFVKNGISALDALCAYAVEGGGFKHVASGNLDGMATEQGYYALTAYFRFLNGETSLYDMTDVKKEEGNDNPVDPEQPTKPETPEGTVTPETGDSTDVVLLVSLMVLSLLAVSALLVSKNALRSGKYSK